MKKNMLIFSCFLIIISDVSYSQTPTFSKVHTILQANCVTGCHKSTNPSGNLDLSGSETDVYNRLVRVTPINPSAKSKGYKLVDPGYPHNSFLLKKINNGEDLDNGLELPQDGDKMPQNQPSLSPEQIQLVQSWILFNASKTDSVVDENLIHDYYNGKGLVSQGRPTSPDPSEGFQLHIGTVFLGPNEEKEYFLKDPLNFSQPMEVNRLSAFINNQSHHYILYKFGSKADADQMPSGPRLLSFTSQGNTQMVSAWQFSTDVSLPEGTGYFWEKDVVLDHNFHLRNYSSDSVLKADIYLNIYAQPRQAQTIEMISDLISYPVLQLYIPNDKKNHTFTSDVKDLKSGNSKDSIFVWMLSTHTHKFGKDYDIYLRNPNGSRGKQLYEGHYDVTHTFPTGFFDYHHPPVKHFDTLYSVLDKDGFIQEAVYNNDSNVSVGFGFTTNDEMMLMYIQYTIQRPGINTGINDVMANESFPFYVYPNPSESQFNLFFELNEPSNVRIDISDISGRMLYATKSDKLKGKHLVPITNDNAHLVPGIYFVTLETNSNRAIRKVVIK